MDSQLKQNEYFFNSQNIIAYSQNWRQAESIEKSFIFLGDREVTQKSMQIHVGFSRRFSLFLFFLFSLPARKQIRTIRCIRNSD